MMKPGSVGRFVSLSLAVLLAAAAIFVSFPGTARAADITWVEYASNPVYDPATSIWAWHPCVLYDANQFSGHGAASYYKMWYQDFTAEPYFKIVYSGDGINWGTPSDTTGLAAGACQGRIVYIAGGYSAPGGTYYYKIWYWKGFDQLYNIDEIHTADSVDGVAWANDQSVTQDATYQLVSGVSPEWNRGTYGPVDVLYNPSATNPGTDSPFDYTFAMYYDATTGGEEVTGLAYSSDGSHWTRYHTAPYENAPVLPHGGSGDWDSAFATFGTVVRESPGVWHMWYSGGQTMVYSGIGYATSTDGINWTKSTANPIMSPATGPAWRNGFTAIPSVIYSPDYFDGHGNACQWKMWFMGGSTPLYSNTAVGYAYSSGPYLTLSKTPSPTGDIVRGQVVTYTLRAGNTGDQPATGCNLTDAVPAYTGYVSHSTTLNGTLIPDTGGTTPLAAGLAVNSPGQPAGTIAAGAEAVVTFRVQVGQDLPLGASVRNTGILTSPGLPEQQASAVNDSSGSLPATWYFAEGSTQPGFDEYILLSNMTAADMEVTITYITEDGRQQQSTHLVPAHSRRTVLANAEMPDESGLAAIVEGSPGLICERSVYFDHAGANGGHQAIGVNAPSLDLFFAEGFTGTADSPFDEWILVLNPGDADSTLHITYMFPDGSTEERDYAVSAHRRLSINVDEQVGEGREVSARITASQPVVAERAMYFAYQDAWSGGHIGKAATGTSPDWYLAEGFTGTEGSLFDEYILVSNDNASDNDVTVTFSFPDGSTQAFDFTAAAQGRLTVNADAYVGEGQMVSAHVHADLPVVVERAMYFDYRLQWQGGHNSLGAAAPMSELYFAEGYTGNPDSQFQTWLLIQNTSHEAKTAVVDYILGSGEVITQQVPLPPDSRTTVYANEVLGAEALEFSMHVRSLDGSACLLAERAMYFDYLGSFGRAVGGDDVLGY